MSETSVVYKAGNSLGDILKNNKAAEETPITVEPAVITPPVVETPTPVAETPAAEPVTPPVETTPPVEVPKETNVADFKFNLLDEPAAPAEQPAQTPAQQPTFDLDDVIKKVDQKELLKKVGVSDFAIEMDAHIRNGGSPEDYLRAKAIDYTKVSDDALLKDDLRKQYPTLQPSQIDMMFERKYSPLSDLDEDKQFAEIQKTADAYKVRQAAIAEQQKFKIADPITPTVVDNSADELAVQQQYEQALKIYNEHPDTQNLMSSKRVVIDLGDDGKFNYNIDKPEYITRALFDGEFWKRITSVNPKEPDASKLVPNVALRQKLAFVAMNPNYERDLVNYGRSLQLPNLVRETQNIVQPSKVIPMNSENAGKIDWTKTKEGKVGDHKN